jgi:hypothetical protein
LALNATGVDDLASAHVGVEYIGKTDDQMSILAEQITHRNAYFDFGRS